MANRDSGVPIATLHHVLHAQPATLGSLAAATGLTPEDIRAALAALRAAGAIYLRDGVVVTRIER